MERQYIRSERAHFMCPNMHFGIKMELSCALIPQKLRNTVQKIAEVRPFLRCVLALEGDMDVLYYKDTGVSLTQVFAFSDEATLWNDYKKIAETDWDVFSEGLLKLYVYPRAEGMTLLFIAHHLLTDGRGLLELAQTFAEMYAAEKIPAYAEERLIRSVRELPEKSALSGVSRFLVRRANRKWKKENHTVDYGLYRTFAQEYGKTHPVEYKMYTVECNALEQIVQKCRANGVSVNDYLMAEMYMRTGTGKIIIAADIRKQLKQYNSGALGNYSTAMGIVCKPKTTDVMETAKQVHALVRKHMRNNRTLMLVLACYFEMDPTLLDAAAISALGGFESKAAGFVGGGMFGFGQPKSYSITNLGRVENEHIRSLQFIPPASPAAKFTLGVVTLNGTMYAVSAENT